MRNSVTSKTSTDRFDLSHIASKGRRYGRLVLFVAGLAATLLMSWHTPQAQRRTREADPKVTGVSSRKVSGADVVTLAADSQIKGIQTWQDPNGTFNITLPGAGDSQIRNLPKGVKARRVGDSLMIEVPARPGANVTVQQRFNRLDLIVSGGIDTRTNRPEGTYSTASLYSDSRQSTRAARVQNSPSTTVERAPKTARSARQARSNAEVKPKLTFQPNLAQMSASPMASVAPTPTERGVVAPNLAPPMPSQVAPAPAQTPATTAVNATPSSEASNAVADGDEESSGLLYPGWWLTALLVGVLASLVFMRSRKSGWEDVSPTEKGSRKNEGVAPASAPAARSETSDERNALAKRSRPDERQFGIRTVGGSGSIGNLDEQNVARQSMNASQGAMFGAYRVDQEVGKLLLGQPHRMDVIGSRNSEDRRAIETSLVKAIASASTEESGRRKATRVLEEYGFVARQCAALLLAPDSYDRVYAARMLGDIRVASSLPFLLEALYDTEPIVRTQAVDSLGLLRMPAAIGALLDMARRYPDMPPAALSKALNACSIESLSIFDAPNVQSSGLLEHEPSERFSPEDRRLETSTAYEALPESVDDSMLDDALAVMKSGETDARASASQSLALFRVQRAVEALKNAAMSDEDSSVRSASVSSLGVIDHESVFPAVLVALGDDAREVRAAAARALSRLSMNRGDAYTRIVEAAGADEISRVAKACVSTGMAAQALDRLASSDRWQEYESFALLSMLMHAKEIAPIMDAIANHPQLSVRLAAIHLLSVSANPNLAKPLKVFAKQKELPDEVRAALVEVAERMSQMQEV